MSNPQIVYLNGQFLPLEQASVSVMDRGFLFGEGVYEVIPAYGGHLLRLDEHLQRLQNSLDGARIPNPLPADEWKRVLRHLLEKNVGEEQSVYLQVTRGVGPKRDHAFPAEVKPTVFAMINPIPPVSRQTLEQGVSATTLDDIRWQACNIKSTALLANTLLRQKALDAGCAEAILIRDGYATEGTVSNVFAVINGRLRTPPKGPLLLPGITRDLVLELAQEEGIDCEEAPISEAELRNAQEIWVTSSTKEIMPVVMLDGKPVGDGKAGKVWSKMIEAYQRYKAVLRGSSPGREFGNE